MRALKLAILFASLTFFTAFANAQTQTWYAEVDVNTPTWSTKSTYQGWPTKIIAEMLPGVPPKFTVEWSKCSQDGRDEVHTYQPGKEMGRVMDCYGKEMSSAITLSQWLEDTADFPQPMTEDLIRLMAMKN